MGPPPDLPGRPHSLAPELTQPQLFIKHAGQPARSPLAGPFDTQIFEPNANDAFLIHWWGPIFGIQRHLLRPGPALGEDLDTLAPRAALAVVDLSKVQHLPLHHPSAAHALIFDDVPVAVLFAIFAPTIAPQKHDGPQLYKQIEAWEEGRSTLQAVLPTFPHCLCDSTAHLPPKKTFLEVELVKSG